MEITSTVISQDCRLMKFLQKAADFNIVETGFFSLDEKVLCLSTQIGCAMKCAFCATANPSSGPAFVRNLSSPEIVSQAINVLSRINSVKTTEKPLFSFMGMGEPFLNYGNVVQSIKHLEEIFPNSRITVSTIGNYPKLIRRFASEQFKVPVKLHLSLHAPNNLLRKKILPCSGKLEPSLDALEFFAKKKNTLPKLNYVLIKGLNDSDENACELADLVSSRPFIVKLSELNSCNSLQVSPNERFAVFERILSSRGVRTVRFFSEGAEISAGCGQLRKSFYEN